MSNTKERILEALKAVQDPDLHQDIVSLGFVKNLAYCDGLAKFQLELTTPACPVKDLLKEQARQAALTVDEVETVNIEMTAQVRHALPTGNQLGGDVRQVIAVTSGKGGVGKSTCAVNLAAALASTGAKVGILDADVYGPNVPVMMGIDRKPEGRGKKIFPVAAYGIKTMSVGYLIEDGQPVMWRGPMLHRALEQFLHDVEWGELDYLIVDMPPGTGDAQLSLSQLVPLTGMVVVTMPQEVSQTDVRRAIGMAQQVKAPVLGVIENMSGEIFGEGGGETVAKTFDLPFLGRIPLESSVRVGGDGGKPIVVEDPESPVAQAFLEIAQAVAAQASTKAQASLPVLEV